MHIGTRCLHSVLRSFDRDKNPALQNDPPDRFATGFESRQKNHLQEGRCPFCKWSQCRDSNPGPAHYECAALPTELHWLAQLNIITEIPARVTMNLTEIGRKGQIYFFAEQSKELSCLPFADGGGKGKRGRRGRFSVSVRYVVLESGSLP